MEYTVTYEDGEPKKVRFPLDLDVQINGSEAIIDYNGIYQSLSEDAQTDVCQALWNFNFVEAVTVTND